MPLASFCTSVYTSDKQVAELGAHCPGRAFPLVSCPCCCCQPNNATEAAQLRRTQLPSFRVTEGAAWTDQSSTRRGPPLAATASPRQRMCTAEKHGSTRAFNVALKFECTDVGTRKGTWRSLRSDRELSIRIITGPALAVHAAPDLGSAPTQSRRGLGAK